MGSILRRWTISIILCSGSSAFATYVRNNPVNYSDPNGLWAVQVGGSVAGLFPTVGGAAESGVAISYTQEFGLQVAGYQSGQARGGVGIYGGASLNVTISPSARNVSDLQGVSVGGGFDTPLGGGSFQVSEIDGRAARSYTGGIGPGAIGDVYGAITYTNVGAPITLGGANQCR